MLQAIKRRQTCQATKKSFQLCIKKTSANHVNDIREIAAT